MPSPEEFDLEVDQSVPQQSRRDPTAQWSWRRALRHSWRAPASWVVLGALLIGTGVLVADGPPPPWQPGIVSHIGTPQPEWTIQVRSAPSFDARIDSPLYLTEETVIVRADEAIHGFAVADGAEMWSVPARHPRCAPPDGTGAMLCTSGRGSNAELLRLDAATGLEAREEFPGLVVAASDGEITYTVHVHPAGTALLQRDGENPWSIALSDNAQWMHQATGASLLVAGDHLLTMVVANNNWYWQIRDTDHGEPSHLGADSLFEGMANDTTWLVHELEHQQWSYLSADGRSSRPMPYRPLFIVDDDPESTVEVHPYVRGELRAETSNGDRVLWHRSGDEEPLARVGDTIVVSESGEAIGVDPQTGMTLWREPLGIPHEYWQANAWMFSDGTTLAFIEPTATGYQFLGLDLATGSELFRRSANEVTSQAGSVDPGGDTGSGRPRTITISDQHVAVATSLSVTLWSLSGPD